jgi:hypothetical protein
MQISCLDAKDSYNTGSHKASWWLKNRDCGHVGSCRCRCSCVCRSCVCVSAAEKPRLRIMMPFRTAFPRPRLRVKLAFAFSFVAPLVPSSFVLPVLAWGRLTQPDGELERVCNPVCGNCFRALLLHSDLSEEWDRCGSCYLH